MAAAITKKLQNRFASIMKSVDVLQASANNVSDPIKPEEAETLTVLLEKITPMYGELENIQESLFELEVDISNEVFTFFPKYAQTIGLAKSKLHSVQQQNQQAPPITKPPPVQLPIVAIPKFSGDSNNWTAFKDSFTSLIHNNVNLSNVHKFHYLQDALKGEAATILKCLSLSDEGYVIAWDRLNKRYQNERTLVKRYVGTLLNLPTMKKGDHISLRHLLDTVAVTISALNKLKRPADMWDDIIIELVSAKLDIYLQKEWEGIFCDKVPTYEEMDTFLSAKCKQLEAVKNNVHSTSDAVSHKPKVLHMKTTSKQCVICNGNHGIYTCSQFLNVNVAERMSMVQKNHLCFNCLSKGHPANQCNAGMCRRCKKKHHTLLHLTETSTAAGETCPASVNFAYSPSSVLLSTCKVIVFDKNGHEIIVRAVLDSGSQVNLITKSCVKRLGLAQRNTNIPIVTAGGKKNQINSIVNVRVKSRISNFNISCNSLVMDNITDRVPSHVLQLDKSIIPPNLHLADPEFYDPQDIDLLIGNEFHYDLLCDGRIKGDILSFFNTHFGWIVYGQMPGKPTPQESVTVNFVGINDVITKFWELENHKQVTLTPVDAKCEEHFRKNFVRDETGRFQVGLPFKDDISRLGNSSIAARQKFFALERRLSKRPSVYAEYRQFMKEYESLGHMRKTCGDVHNGYYLPHHCVLKENSLSTKLRVVFNGSAPSSTGVSLNDILMVGPPVQNDLFSILARMRCYKFVITADIAKMYRQVNVRSEDCKYQRIWWRNTPEDELISYELTTVTYGTAPAAFLAIRVVQELAEIECRNYPIGSDKCLKDFYVDDLITGSDNLENLIEVRDQVNNLLQSGGFELKKWASNNKHVFSDFKTDCVDNITVLTRESDSAIEAVSTLGMIWNTLSDTLSYKHNVIPSNATTRRGILSEISRIYDPLGLIGPITIIGKIFIQDIWKLKCGWDDAIPSEYINRWLEYADDLKHVPEIIIPRMVVPSNTCELEIHGFSDASELAYGACVYLVEVSNNKRITSSLLCAKSRVAPVKATSIPRLELCAALLLTELCERVQNALNKTICRQFYYSDSSITLSWIKLESRRFKTFVANRVGQIHNLTNPNQWFHVSTQENPADIISRGSPASSLKDNKLWWYGPDFLRLNLCPSVFIPEEVLPEVKCNLAAIDPDDSIIPECDTFEKTVRVIAFMLRFANKIRGHLRVHELKKATIVLMKTLQHKFFKRELSLIANNSDLPKSSKLLSLNPFLDSDGIIRVGGRLSNSDLNFNRKFPIVLPPNHRLVRLLAESVHKNHLHVGAQGCLAAMRLQYWPLRGRSITRDVVRKCIRCIRAKPNFQAPFMSALPSYRTQQFRPFLRVGVDYCGPFVIKDESRRAKKTIKAYVCIFVCCATKAVHIELVSTLSTDSFLAAFSRFISRRGNVVEILSDNGTNFVGARNHLRELGLFLTNENNNAAIEENLTQRHIKWSFIPPRAPHFGGLWEAAVKSFKCHLHRVAGNALLTAEELTTLLAQIEAVLNSRPLCSLSDDPSDYAALTPSHFLIGDVLTAPVEDNFQDTPDNRLSRWELIQKMRQHIWKRWSREYLSELHKRTKWHSRDHSIDVGHLVIIKDDNLPPLRWQLGRIEALHHGSDGISRSATVRTSSTTIVRPVVKLCVLPVS